MLTISIPSLAALPAAARQLAAAIVAADYPVVAFEGEMGRAKPRLSAPCVPSWGWPTR